MRKSLTIIAVIVGVLAFATPALAHTPSVTPSCSGLAVSLAAYDGPSTNNRVTTTIDGVATVVDFGASYSATFNWSQTVPHTWSVVIDANRSTGNATQFDVSFSGTWQACQPTATTVAPTTTVEPTTTTVEPTTTTDAATTTTAALVASQAPATTSTTTATGTGSGLVASQAPVPPADANSAVVQLPATGYAWGPTAILGLAMLGLGLALIGLRRRSRPVSG
jgi:LPXTG-motif cell wall-anchored protein